jgi:hypothetical protein
MKKLAATLTVLLLTIVSFAQSSSSKKINIPFTADKWDFQQGKVKFIDHKGFKAVQLDEHSGNMIFKDLQFTNGTIEFDVEVNRALPFPTIYFHWKSNDESEHVYLRTGAKPGAIDAVQYASIVKGVNMWDLQYEFQSAANLKIADWNHVKVIVSGKRLKAYINNSTKPNLDIPCLEGSTTTGRIGIGTGFPGQAIFANLTVQPNAVEGLSATALADPAGKDNRYIRNWQTSSPEALPGEVTADLFPKSDVKWMAIRPERRGLVNLSRKFGLNTSRKYVWLRTTIQSAQQQKSLLRMGFSDEIWVFVNKQPVYSDKNLYIQNRRKNPDGRISIENCSLEVPLNKGVNELLVAVANDFYGWGIMARLEKMDGILLK